ncbi:MAG: hypothetical protein ACRDQI_12720 [Pseudonocardiaceae bacterium]
MEEFRTGLAVEDVDLDNREAAALQPAGYQVFPINPLAVSRHRDRYVVSRHLGVSLVGTAAGTRPLWVIPS